MRNDPVAVSVEAEELFRLMDDVFAEGGTFRFLPAGVSMLPTLREKRDSVLLCSPERRPPQKYDVVLYRRENGRFVLHRIIGADKSGFVLCGDHQYLPERGVRPDQIRGVLVSFRRNGREVSADAGLYRRYVKVWTLIRPLRGLVYRGCGFLRRMTAVDKRRGEDYNKKEG